MPPVIVNHAEALRFLEALADRSVQNFLVLAFEELILPFVRPVGMADAAYVEQLPDSSVDMLFVAKALERLFRERRQAVEKALRGEDITPDF